MLSIYDDALLRFFSRMKWGDAPFPFVLAAPDRAHAAIEEWLKLNKGVISSKTEGNVTIPYPFAAIYRPPFKDYEPLQSPVHHRGFAKDIEKGVGYTVRVPKNVITEVDVNFYLDDTTQADYVEIMVHNLFGAGSSFVSVDYAEAKWYHPPNDVFSFAKCLGQTRLQFDMNDLSDNSTIEDSGLANREIRYTLGCSLHGLIPFQPEAIPLVEKVELQVAHKDTEETLIVVTAEN